MTVPYFDRMIVADIATLKTLTDVTTPAIADGIFIAVEDIGGNEKGWYYYDALSTETASEPLIITPTSGIGRWFKFGQGFEVIYGEGGISNTTVTPKYDGQNGGLSFHFMKTVSYGSNIYSLLLGVDTTGVEGTNGWIEL